MPDALDYRSVLRVYPADCQPQDVEFLDTAGGLSGARLWRLSTPRGLLLLRRWPREHPPRERLEFIQAVQWHARQEGFEKLALPLETVGQRGYVEYRDHLWELAPWLPGQSDYRANPSQARLRSALATLAEFHQAVATFPLAEATPGASPGISERLEQLRILQSGAFDRLRSLVAQARDDYRAEAQAIVELFPPGAPLVAALLEQAAPLEVPLAPCLRDIWHENVLFAGDEVSGLIDFGSMRPDNVAADVARLLGSMAEDNRQEWREGLAAYEALRPLSELEAILMTAFDASGVLLGGINWLTWIYERGRTFAPQAVLDRLQYFHRRLAKLIQRG